MNKIDFSHAGGFPLTQDQLDYLQQAAIACLNGLALAHGAGPVALTPLVYTYDGGTLHYNLPAGWIFYNGEMLYTAGGYVTDGSLGPAVLGFTIQDNTTNLTYNNGSNFPALHSKVAVWSAVAAGGGAGIIRYSDLVPFGQGFGLNARESAFSTIAVSIPANDITGTIEYKKNALINAVQIEMTVAAVYIDSLSDAPGGTVLTLGTLPVGYRPASNKTLMAQMIGGAGAYVQLDGGGVATCAPVKVNSDGSVILTLAKPAGGTASLIVTLSALLPLD